MERVDMQKLAKSICMPGSSILSNGQQDILNIAMDYVHDAPRHNVDKRSIESRLEEIETEIQGLAMDIENGNYEMSCNETK